MLGRVSFRVGDLRACDPGARPGLGFASSLAQAQTTLSPILQAFPGFLSHWPHPAWERCRVGRASSQTLRFSGARAGQTALACSVASGF